VTYTPIGSYRPGTSVLHRIPAGVKLPAMLAGMVALVLLRHPWQLAVAAGLVVLGFGAARIPPRAAAAQLWPLRYVVVVIAVLQVILAGWRPAVMVCGIIVVGAALAALVTLTTRVSAMLDAITAALRPLRHVGADPDRVALVLAMTIRCIPLLVDIVHAVSEARVARGVGFSVKAVAAPTVVRALRAADALGDALIARGADD
jgi:biotin transport system permease protein